VMRHRRIWPRARDLPACERSWLELEPCAVHQQVDRFAAWSWSRHRQCLAPSAERRVIAFVDNQARGTEGSNPLPSSGEPVSLPELLSRVGNPGFVRGWSPTMPRWKDWRAKTRVSPSDSLVPDRSTVTEKRTCGIPTRSERKSRTVAVASRQLPS
jgi:hypothetical protein